MTELLAAQSADEPGDDGGWRLSAPEWLEVQAQVVAILGGADELSEAVAQVLDVVGHALRWDVGAFWEYDADAVVLRCAAVWNAVGDVGLPYETATRSGVLGPGESLPGRVHRAIAPVWVLDLAAEPNLPRADALAASGLRSALAFPVRARDEVLGVVELLSRAEHDPEAVLLQALDAIGAQIGQFIEFRRAQDRLALQARLLEALSEAAVDGILLVAPDGRIVSHNRRFLQVWDLPDEAGGGADAAAIDLALPKVTDPEAFVARVRWWYEHPEESGRDEIRLLDGRILDRHTVPLATEPDAPPHRVWFFRDVTEDRRREEQQAYLAEAGAVLGAGLDQEATLKRIAELAVPQLADWAMVYLTEEDGSIRRVAIAHRADDRHPAAVAAATLSTHPDIDPQARAGVPEVIRTGLPQLHPVITPEAMAADAADPQAQAAVLRELRLRSWICVPLTARGVTFGALSLVTSDSARRYGGTDLRFAEQIALRAALALDNARLYGRSHATAEGLQRSLLPERLPEIAGARFAARYLPGSPGAAVGGDWYDALVHTDGSVGVAIGDVAGRGVGAAATMGQLRTALRAYAMEGHGAHAALARLESFHAALGDADVATAQCLSIELATGALELASAGHLPPLVVAPDGSAALLPCAPGVPLGAGPAEHPGGGATTLPRGATILLYTDGLVERRGESIEVGMQRLVHAARGHCADPEELCDAVLEALVGGRRRPDDVALIALRRE